MPPKLTEKLDLPPRQLGEMKLVSKTPLSSPQSSGTFAQDSNSNSFGSFAFTSSSISPSSVTQQQRFELPFDASQVKKFFNGAILWVGDEGNASSWEQLKKNKITHVLNVASDCEPDPDVLKNIPTIKIKKFHCEIVQTSVFLMLLKMHIVLLMIVLIVDVVF